MQTETFQTLDYFSFNSIICSFRWWYRWLLYSDLSVTVSLSLSCNGSVGSGSQDADSDEEWPALGGADVSAVCDTEVVVDPDDEMAIEMFMNKNPPMRQDAALPLAAVDTELSFYLRTLSCVFSLCSLQTDVSWHHHGEDNREADWGRNSDVRGVGLSDAPVGPEGGRSVQRCQ